MDGIHDLGGMHGLGPVLREIDEPVFHADWQRRVFGMMLSVLATGRFSVDSFRYAIERMAPAEYLQTSYYEHWLHAVETLLRENGLLDGAPPEGGPALTADRVPGVVASGGSARINADAPVRFQPGDKVLTRNMHPIGHTRLPRYARGRHGTVVRDEGVFLFPDTYAMGQGANPQRVYNVRFDGREIWGDSADPNSSIHLDLFDHYLLPA